jgi:hypothetical protein
MTRSTRSMLCFASDPTTIWLEREGIDMSRDSIARFRAAALAIAPAVMFAGFLYHPHLGNPTDADFLARLAEAVVADPLRWAVAHLLVAVGSGLLALAFLAVRGQLREAGEERWSGPALPFIIMGSAFYALLPAMELAPLAAATAGADLQGVQDVQAALYVWFIPTLFISASLFLIGAVGFALGIARSRIPDHRLARIVATALIVMAVSRFVPVSFVQFYVQGAAGLVALWPLAYVLATRPSRQPVENRRPAAPAPAVPT